MSDQLRLTTLWDIRSFHEDLQLLTDELITVAGCLGHRRHGYCVMSDRVPGCMSSIKQVFQELEASGVMLATTSNIVSHTNIIIGRLLFDRINGVFPSLYIDLNTTCNPNGGPHTKTTNVTQM